MLLPFPSQNNHGHSWVTVLATAKTTNRDDPQVSPVVYNGMRNSRKYQTLRASYPASILNYVMFVIRISLSLSLSQPNFVISILSKYIVPLLYFAKKYFIRINRAGRKKRKKIVIYFIYFNVIKI